MAGFDELLDRLEELLAEVETFDEPVRARVFELLDGIDALHRMALDRLPDAVGSAGVERLRAAHPALEWLLDAYGVGVDQRLAADRAIDEVRGYVHSHGGEVDVIEVRDGVVRVALAGSCAGCTASAITLREGVERSLRERFPGFQRLEVREDDAPAHPPPGPTLLQIEKRIP